MFGKYETPDLGFGDVKKENILDSNNYDFKFALSDYKTLSDEIDLISIPLKAVSKRKK